jgi:hypothetical protein
MSTGHSVKKRKRQVTKTQDTKNEKKRRKVSQLPVTKNDPPAPVENTDTAISKEFPDVIIEEVPYINKEMEWAYSDLPQEESQNHESDEIYKPLSPIQVTTSSRIESNEPAALTLPPTTAPSEKKTISNDSLLFDSTDITRNIVSSNYDLTITEYHIDIPNMPLFDHMMDIVLLYLYPNHQGRFYCFPEISRYATFVGDKEIRLGSECTRSSFDSVIPCLTVGPSTPFSDILYYFRKITELLLPLLEVKSPKSVNILLASLRADTHEYHQENKKSVDPSRSLEISKSIKSASWIHNDVYDFSNLKWALSKTVLGPGSLFVKVGIDMMSSLASEQQERDLELYWALLLVAILFRHKFMQYKVKPPSRIGCSTPEIRCEFLRPFSWAIERVALLKTSGETKMSNVCLTTQFEPNTLLYTVVHTMWVMRHTYSNGVLKQLGVDKLYFLLPTYINRLPPQQNDDGSDLSVDEDEVSDDASSNGPTLPAPVDPMNQKQRLREFISLMAGFSIKTQILQSHPFEVHNRPFDRLGLDPYAHSSLPGNGGRNSLDELETRLRNNLLDELSREKRVASNGYSYSGALSAIACSRGMDYEFVSDCLIDIKKQFLQPSFHMKTTQFSIWVRAFDFNIICPEEQSPLLQATEDNTKPKHKESSSALLANCRTRFFCPYYCWWTLPELNFVIGHNVLDIYKATKAAEAIINIEQLGEIPSVLSASFRAHIDINIEKSRQFLSDPKTIPLVNAIYARFDHPDSNPNKEYVRPLSATPTLNACYLSVDLNVITAHHLKLYNTISLATRHPILTSFYGNEVPLSASEFYKSNEIKSKNNKIFNDALSRQYVILLIHLAIDIYSRRFTTRLTQSADENNASLLYALTHDLSSYYSWVLTKKQLIYRPIPFIHAPDTPYSNNNMYYTAHTPRMRDVGHTASNQIWYSFSANGSKTPITKFNESVMQTIGMQKQTSGVVPENPVDSWINILKHNRSKTEATLLVQNENTKVISSHYYKIKHKELAQRWTINPHSQFVHVDKQLHNQAIAEMLSALVGSENNCLVARCTKLFDDPQITSVTNQPIKVYIHAESDQTQCDVDSTSYGYGQWVDTKMSILPVSKQGTFTERVFYALSTNSVWSKDGEYMDALDLTYTFKTCLDQYIQQFAGDSQLLPEASSILSQIEGVAYRTTPNIPNSIHQLSLFDTTAKTLCGIPLESYSTDPAQAGTSLRKIFVTTKSQILNVVLETPYVHTLQGFALSPDTSLTSFILTYNVTKHGIGKYNLIYPVFDYRNNSQEAHRYLFVYVPIKSRRTVDFLVSSAVCIIKPTSK